MPQPKWTGLYSPPKPVTPQERIAWAEARVLDAAAALAAHPHDDGFKWALVARARELAGERGRGAAPQRRPKSA